MRFLSLLIFFLASCHSGLHPLPGTQDVLDRNVEEPDVVPEVASPSPPIFRKGVTLVCWYPGCFAEEEETLLQLDYLKNLGVEWLAIVPTWYQATTHTSEIFQDEEESPTDDDIRYVVAQARERGFKILLKPHIDILFGGSRLNIDPSDLFQWQNSYRAFITHYAEMAAALNVEIFAIGTELKRRSGDLLFWNGVIERVRGIYGGALTYAANWDEYENVSFWDRLDFIGIDFYYPLTDNLNPTTAELEMSLRNIGQTIQTFSNARQRPVLFTEIGYRSIDGANTRPYDFRWNQPIDLQEQADCYEAVLTAFQNADWLRGVFWWRADPRLIGGPNDRDYFFYDKPAAEVLRRFWR